MTESAPAAFFSYCREDSEFAHRLAEDLKAAGVSVWLHQLDIVPGQRWDSAVEDALANCPRVLVILSPASVNSTNVMDEEENGHPGHASGLQGSFSTVSSAVR